MLWPHIQGVKWKSPVVYYLGFSFISCLKVVKYRREIPAVHWMDKYHYNIISPRNMYINVIIMYLQKKNIILKQRQTFKNTF